MPVATLLILAAAPAVTQESADGIRVELGRRLFFDPRFSARGNQSCASCHDPARAFSDGRDNGVRGAASIGSDGVSLGDRNAPALTYVSLVPEFGTDPSGQFAGGLFHDGRAAGLGEQAREPFTNPLEMALPDAAAVVARVRDDAEYESAFVASYGPGVFDDDRSAFAATVDAIAEYEKSADFSTFDSRYDRSLRGEVSLTRDEEIGRMLFFSQLVNCHLCHLVEPKEHMEREPFTNHRYHNIGLPRNDELRNANGLGADHRDSGLAANPASNAAANEGKFRVPSLRNVAVTGPYMHNGVFAELETAVVFYNRFLLAGAESLLNPETGRSWGGPETPATVDQELLRQGQPLSDVQVRALVAFLKALTDRRFEHLIDD